MKKSSRVMVIIMAAGMVLLGLSTAGFAASVIKIGYTAPFTGSAAEFGVNGWRGIQLALEEINKKGVMVAGKKHTIEIKRYDSICTPTDGVANVRKLAMQDKVVAILGDHCSSVCVAIAPLCDQFKIPGLTIECAADKVTKPGHEFYFRMRPSVGLMAPLFTPTIVKKFKPKSAAFLVVNDDYGLGLASAISKELDKFGVKTVLTDHFERGNTDFMVYLAKIKKAKADVAFYVGVVPEGAMILKQAREMGLTESAKLIGSEEMGEMELVSLAGAEATEGTYAVSLWGSVPADFSKRVTKRFNAPMHYAIIFAYDALQTVTRAIELAQSLDPVKIKDAMKKVDYQGLEGHIKFEDFEGYRNQCKFVPAIIKWEGGNRVPLK
jgi:branched-chain amino acid transport system substrate-binding protein